MNISDIFRSNVEEILGQKASDEQIEDLSQSLFLIIKKQQNYLLNQFDIANQTTYFPNQQSANYPYSINIFLQLNSQNNGSIFSPYGSNYTNGFIPNNNYQIIAQPPTPFPTIPLMQYPNISILPPLSLLNESPVHKTKTEKKKEKTPTKTTSKKSKKESKSRKGKEKSKKVSKKAKKSKKSLKKATKNEPKDTDEIFSPYVVIILNIVHPDLHIPDSGIKDLNTLLIKIYKKLVAESIKNSQSELDQLCIENAVRSFVPGDLAKHGICEGNKAVAKFNTLDNADKTKRAGLVVNVEVIYRLLVNGKYANSISENAAVF